MTSNKTSYAWTRTYPSWTVKNRTTGELFAGYDADGDARWTDNKDNAVVFREYRSAEEVATMYGAVMVGDNKITLSDGCQENRLG